MCLFENRNRHKQRLRIKASIIFKLFYFELWTPANVEKNPEDFDRLAEMSVRVQKSCFMLEIP